MSLPLESVPCDLCGKDDSEVLYEEQIAEDWTLAQVVASSDRYGVQGRVVRCRSCGLVYRSPRIRYADLAEAYRGTRDEDYMVESESRGINAFLCLAVLRRHQPEGRLLEIGCSTGFLLHAARVWFEPRGIELSEWSASFVREKLGLPVDAPTLEEAGFEAASFDAVAMVDVIEHLPSPRRTLRETARVLKPGGHLYMVTPDIGGLAAFLLGRYWWAIRPGHLYYFSKETMARMLEEEGFELVYYGSYGRIFSLGYWLSRLRTYPRIVQAPFRWIIGALGLETKFLYLNTRDAMEIVARKK